jgi:hypothetical protein
MGTLSVFDAEQKEKSWQIEAGLLKVHKDTVTILIGL